MRLNLSRAVVTCLLSGCIGIVLPPSTFAEDTAQPSLAESFPPGALACVEGDGLGPLAERIRGSELLEQIVLSPQFQQYEESPRYQRAQNGRLMIEAVLDNDLWTTFEKVLGGRWAVALYPGDDSPRPNLAALIEVSDAEFLAALWERLNAFLDLAGDRIERFELEDGRRGFEARGRASVVVGEQNIFVATTRDLLDRLLDPDQESEHLSGDERYLAMRSRLGEDHHVRAYVDSEAVSQLRGARMGLPEKLDNPLGSLLLSGLLELAAESPYLGATVDVEEDGFAVVLGGECKMAELPASHQVFFSSGHGAGAAAVPQVEGLIGGVTLYRDIDGWYRQRESYLVPEVLPGFDKFETGIGNLLPGRDIGEDVLPLLGDRITLLAALQSFDHLHGEPGIKLPAFAAVIELAEPQRGSDMLRLFFQTLTAVLNLQAGQQGREPWIMDSESYGGTQIAFARYLSAPEGDALPIVFNFRPTSAQVGNRFVVASSVQLCRALVDACNAPSAETEQANEDFELEVHADAAADALGMNRGLLEARAIQAGREPEQAGEEVSALLDAIRSLESLRLTTSADDGTFELRLQGNWK